ncbi:response regulator transcription factor [Kocuria sp.]|uniref:response regulator n=1 Tax=Kocuria sp. TaxID=1871328 RepID=UPI0026DD8730|nr:response regulator transcription factor [Kocuria sp.]MDO4918967.1 response regulator transcription factor [Kocuria sp.]
MTAPAPPVRVLIVDDQPLVRGGFRMLVDSQPDLTVVADVGDGAAAVDSLRATAGAPDAPDVILMDVRMPRLDGIGATREVLRLRPDARIIVLTTFDLDEYALEAIRAGASGFLLKDARPEELLDAIRTVARGDAVIAPSTTRRLLSHLVAGPGGVASPPVPSPATARDPWSDPRLSSLTAREREVFELIGGGCSNGEIMQRLFLSEPTVKTHVSHILAKLGARDRVQAVVIAYETGVVLPG